MCSDRWTRNNTTVFNIGYHLIWCPKYRKKFLYGQVEQRLKQLLNEKTFQIHTTIEQIEIMPDHIHIFLKSIPCLSIETIVKHLKGYTSYILRKEFKFLRKYKTLWTRSYYCETIGHISEATIKKYIKEQRLR